MADNKAKMTKNPLDIIKTLVREGKLDDDTAQFLNSLTEQSVVIRNAMRRILENYRTILDAIAAIRVRFNAVLDNVEDVPNHAED